MSLFQKITSFLNPSKKFKLVSPKQFNQEIRENPGLTKLIDTRSSQEFLAGHVPNAIHIDLLSPKFAEEIEKLDKNETYLVYCQRGSRSINACKTMHKKGFANLRILKGGYVSWKKSS